MFGKTEQLKFMPMKNYILYFNFRNSRLGPSAFLLMASLVFSNNFSLGQSEQVEPEFNINNRELVYKEVNEEELTLNIYSSAEEGAASNLPIVVFFHGGGYTRGSKNDVTIIDFFHHTLFTLIEENKINVVSIDFRNADENTAMPDIIADCKDALQWLGSNAGDQEIDAQNMGLIGHSSGAQLALMTGLSQASDIPEDDSLQNNPYRVAFIISLSAPTDFFRQVNDSQKAGDKVSQKMKKTLDYLFRGKVDEVPDRYTEASPVNYLNDKSPPTLILTGTKDKRLQNNSQWLKEAADEVGAKADLIIVENAGHRIYRGGPDASPSLPELTDRIQQYIVNTFYPSDTKVTL
jgi:acetyl esterase/lipase